MRPDHLAHQDTSGFRRIVANEGAGGAADWLSIQMARAQALGLRVDCAPYFEDFGPPPVIGGTPVPITGEFTISDRTVYALWQDGGIGRQLQYPSGVVLIDANGPTPGSLAFAWSLLQTGVLDAGDWYAASRVEPIGVGDLASNRLLVSGFFNWDFLTFAMLYESQGGFVLALQRQGGGPSHAVVGGVCDLSAAHDYAIAYDLAADTATAFCDGLLIPGLDALPSAGQYMPSDPGNQGGCSVGVWGPGSSPLLVDKLAFLTGSLGA